MWSDDRLLTALGAALVPDATPPRDRVDAVRAHVIAVGRRRAPRRWRRVVVAFAVLAALVGGAAIGHDLPRPVRQIAHAIGLPVESTTLVDAREQLDRLGRALSRRDAGEAIAADKAMLAFVKELSQEEKEKIVPVAHEVHERALTLLRQMGICSSTGTCPPP
jgi:hypothetical protein